MTNIESIERMGIYYQEFHHKCVTWYITIMGFFIASLITAPEPNEKMQFMWMPILVFSILFGLLFFFLLFHYGARINVLNGYLEGDANQIPGDWRKKHKNVGLTIHGVGSYFFMVILILMQLAMAYLLVARHG